MMKWTVGRARAALFSLSSSFAHSAIFHFFYLPLYNSPLHDCVYARFFRTVLFISLSVSLRQKISTLGGKKYVKTFDILGENTKKMVTKWNIDEFSSSAATAPVTSNSNSEALTLPHPLIYGIYRNRFR